MAYLAMATLLLVAGGTTLGLTIDHEARLDHRGDPVTVTYRGDVVVTQRQVGAVAPGGRASSLRCDWAARMTVARHAVATSGASLSRRIDSAPLVSGTRAGWCGIGHKAISNAVARDTATLQRHMETLAQQDEDVLRTELDRLHAGLRTG